MNDPQDPGSQTDAEMAPSADETSSPKRRRAPRKTVTAPDLPGDAPPVAEVSEPAPSLDAQDAETEAQPARKRTRKPAAPALADAAVAEEVLTPRPKRVRAPRAATSDLPVAASTSEDTPREPLVPVVEASAAPTDGAAPVRVPVAGGELSLGAPLSETEVDQAADNHAAAPEADTAAPVMPVAEAAARFEDVLSGQYDAEAETPVEEADVDPGKRVLSPEPEAPKLHKVLAQSGIGSRRDMEALIEAGQVMVNGEVAHLGMRVTYGDQIKVSGKPVRVRIAPGPARVLAYHKPVGEVVTHNDPEGRPTVFRHLPRLASGRWLSVGRLDLNTEGLLLFTNSGDLANQLMHPRFGVEREYAVRVLGTLDEQSRDLLLEGVTVDGQVASFLSIQDGGGEGINRWYRVVIAEGRNREVRKLFDVVGLTVNRLIRIRYGTVVLPRGLKRGVWVELDDNDVRVIRRLAGAEPQQPREGRGPRGKGRPERGAEGDRPERGPRGDRKQRESGRPQGAGFKPAEQGAPRAEGAPSAAPGAEGDFVRAPRQDGPRGAPQQQRQNHKPGRPAPQGAQGGPRQNNGNNGPGGKGPRGPRPGGPGPSGGGQGGGGGGSRERDFEDPMRIPNPLEQTFDKRFATGSKRITTGFGRPTEEPMPGDKKGGPKQPDPMQTSVGYIGAEAYFRSPALGKGRGRRR